MLPSSSDALTALDRLLDLTAKAGINKLVQYRITYDLQQLSDEPEERHFCSLYRQLRQTLQQDRKSHTEDRQDRHSHLKTFDDLPLPSKWTHNKSTKSLVLEPPKMVSSSEFKQYKEDLLQKKQDQAQTKERNKKRKGREKEESARGERKKTERKRGKEKKKKGMQKKWKKRKHKKRDKEKKRQINRKRQKTDGDNQNADTDMKRPTAVDIDNAHANGNPDTDNDIKHLTTEDIENALASGVLIPVSGPSFNRDVCFGCAGEKDNGSMYSVQMMKV